MAKQTVGRSDFFVRRAKRSDVMAMVDVFRDAVRNVARRDYSADQVKAWAPNEIDVARWERDYETIPAWVAEADSHIVGFTDLEPDGHVDMMFVHSGFQSRGVASALLAAVEEAAREQGIGRLHTEASITARPFFERRDFALIAAQTVTVNDVEFVNFRMEKMLRP